MMWPDRTDPEAGPYASWHVHGRCDRHVRDEASSPVTVRLCGEPAACWWLAPNGCWFSYCTPCTARARALAAEWGQDLEPVRLTLITAR